jgi:hypothetical protein
MGKPLSKNQQESLNDFKKGDFKNILHIFFLPIFVIKILSNRDITFSQGKIPNTEN